jgi:hypothetical protein
VEKRTLNETDVRMMARGCWGEYFEWLVHPKAKLPLLMAGLCTGLLVLVLIVGSASTQVEQTLPAAVKAVMGVLALCAFGCAASALYTIGKERSEFLTESVETWRRDAECLPSREQIKRFINRR